MGQYQLQQNEIIEGKKYFRIETSRSFNVQEQIIDHLRQRRGLKEVHSVDECDVILVFCPIVSRAGTDIDAALKKLDNACSGNVSRPVIFMVLHPTFDPDKTVPDSSRFINRMNTLTVDFLFSEDEGLLKCSINDEALNKIVYHFKSQEKNYMGYLILVIVAIVVLWIMSQTTDLIYPIVIIGIVISILYSVQVWRKH